MRPKIIGDGVELRKLDPGDDSIMRSRATTLIMDRDLGGEQSLSTAEQKRTMRVLGAQVNLPPERACFVEYVACRAGHPIGVIQARPNIQLILSLRKLQVPFGNTRETLVITKLAVADGNEGQGIGRALVNEVLSVAPRLGFTYVAGFADGDPARLRSFYTACGFTCEPESSYWPIEIIGPAGRSLVRTDRRGFFFWKPLN